MRVDEYDWKVTSVRFTQRLLRCDMSPKVLSIDMDLFQHSNLVFNQLVKGCTALDYMKEKKRIKFIKMRQ